MATVNATGTSPRTPTIGVVTAIESMTEGITVDAVGLGPLTEDEDGGSGSAVPTEGQTWPRGQGGNT
jgi:hypothetical protein